MMIKKNMKVTVIVMVFLSLQLLACTTGNTSLDYPFTNPVASRADDPWVIYDDRPGYDCYYYVWSGGNGVRIAAMDDFYKLGEVYNIEGRYIQAWKTSFGTDYSSEIWAPELHFLNDRWYIYVAASNGSNETHRMYVLESNTENPMDGFNFIGKISPATDRWAIDGTIMRYQGKMYFIWSGWEGTVNVAQHLYIAEMESPVKLLSDKVKISSPELEWERIGNPLINEGPFAIEHNGLMHLMYSASGSWTDDYCIGLLSLTGSDPLDPSAWTKKQTPILEKKDGMYGPGHPSITRSRDGREWLMYHANSYPRIGWRGRQGWAQLIMWDSSNYPVIYLPAAGS